VRAVRHLRSVVFDKRIALLLLLGPFAVFGAVMVNTKDRAPPQILALAVGGDGTTLLEMRADKLYRRAAADGAWAQVPLPRAVAPSRITAIAAVAKSSDVLYLAGQGLGVWRSDNGGRDWEARNDGLPSREAIAVTAHADRPETVYAYLAGNGIFRSEDAGKHWKQMDGGPRAALTQFVHSNMPGSMQSGWLFAATRTGVARSMDCFCGWYDAGGLNAKVHAVAYAPNQPQRVYAATEKGLFVSVNGGEEWRRAQAPAGSVTALAVARSGTVYAASGSKLFRSTDGGQTWERVDA